MHGHMEGKVKRHRWMEGQMVRCMDEGADGRMLGWMVEGRKEAEMDA